MDKGIKIFFSYAHKDEDLRDELIKHLSEWKRQGLISIWHDRNINAGTEWQREIDIHLNTAQIILLLVSPDFMASEYCSSIEAQRAMERHEAGTACVIPVILRPVHWQDAPFGKLYALPTNAEPVRSPRWHSQDEAFFDVAKGIYTVITELNTKSLPHALENVKQFPPYSIAENATLSVSESTTSLSRQQAIDAPLKRERTILQPPLEPVPNANAFQKDHPAKKRTWKSLPSLPKRRTLKLFAGLIIAAGSGLSIGWVVIRDRVLHLMQTKQSALPQKGVTPGLIQDQNLAAHFINTQQSAIALPGDPAKLKHDQLPTQKVSALCIGQQSEQSILSITIGISNLRQDQYVLVIEQVQLLVERITFVPRPLYVLIQNPATLSDHNVYRAYYTGQDPNIRIFAKYDNPPNDYVFLAFKETDEIITLQIASLVEVFLSFRVAITYRVANEERSSTLVLPNVFQVIFTHKNNWYPYQMRNGHFTQLETP